VRFDGTRLRALRRQAGYSQEDLADRAGVGLRTLRDAELGKRQPHGYIIRRLALALGCDPAELRRDLSRDAVLAAVGTELGSTASAAPNQLPDPPANFVGREGELASLAGHFGLLGGAVSIEGMPGVGKTALALALAMRLRFEFPDGLLMLDLRGEFRALGVPAAMRHVIGSIDPRHSDVADENRLAATYRSVLRGRRVLLVLDDAADADQVEALLPPRPNGLIVTTRRALRIEGASSLTLYPLARSASRALLAGAPMNDAQVDALATCCGDLPLALVLLARALRRPDCDPAEVVASLTQPHRGVASGDPVGWSQRLGALLGESQRTLAAQDRNRFGRLCAFAGTFDRSAAQAMWQVDSETAAGALRRLQDRHLVVHVHSVGRSARYRLHALIRAHMKGEQNRSELREAQRLHARHFARRLEQWSRAWSHQERAAEEVAGFMRDEAVNLESMFEWAVANAVSDGVALEVLIASAGASALILSEDAASASRWVRLAFDRVEPNRQPAAAARILHVQARLDRILRRLESARRASRRALELARRAGDSHLIEELLVNAGLIEVMRRHTGAAFAALVVGDEPAAEIRSESARAEALLVSGMSKVSSGELPDAERLLHAAAGRVGNLRSQFARAMVPLYQALCASFHGERERAGALAAGALEIFRALEDERYVPSEFMLALLLTAQSQLDSDRLERVPPLIDELCRRAADAGDSNWSARARALAARAAIALGQPRVARREIDAAIIDARSDALPRITHRVHLVAAEYARAVGEPKQLREWVERAVVGARQTRAPHWIGLTHLRAGSLWLAMRHAEAGIEHIELGLPHLRVIGFRQLPAVVSLLHRARQRTDFG